MKNTELGILTLLFQKGRNAASIKGQEYPHVITYWYDTEDLI